MQRAIDFRNIIMCNRCLDVIESATRHEFNWCKCKRVAVDGGRAYQRITGEEEDFFIVDAPFETMSDRVGKFRIVTNFRKTEFHTMVWQGAVSKPVFSGVSYGEETAKLMHNDCKVEAEQGIYEQE